MLSLAIGRRRLLLSHMPSKIWKLDLAQWARCFALHLLQTSACVCELSFVLKCLREMVSTVSDVEAGPFRSSFNRIPHQMSSGYRRARRGYEYTERRDQVAPRTFISMFEYWMVLEIGRIPEKQRVENPQH